MSEERQRRSWRAAFTARRDELEQQRLPADSYGRLQAKLAKRNRRRVGPMVFALAAATCAAVALVVYLPRDEVAGFELARREDVVADTAGTLTVLASETLLRLPAAGVEITARRDARLRLDAEKVRLELGTARFDVTPRGHGAPFQVAVSHGTIEVMGTSFVIDQGAQGGSATLLMGQVRFLGDDGRVEVLTGEASWQWGRSEEAPLPAETAPPVPEAMPERTPPPPMTAPPPKTTPPKATVVEPTPPAAPPPAPSPSGTEKPRSFMVEIDALRIRRDYVGLARVLTEALNEVSEEPLREHLSVELAEVLLRHGDDAARACDHARQHQQRYPQGSASASLRRKAAAKGCEP